MEENNNNIEIEESNPVSELQPTIAEVETNGKKSSPLIPVLIVLVVLVLGLGGYLLYDKVFADKNNKKQELQQEKEDQQETTIVEEKQELDINDSTVQKLFNTFRGDHFAFISKLANNNMAKLRFVYENISKTDYFETILCTKVF